MVFNRKKLKYEARRRMSRGGFSLLWKTALLLVILATVGQLSMRVTGIDKYVDRVYDAAQTLSENIDVAGQEDAAQDFARAMADIPQPGFAASVIALLLSLVTAFLSNGYRWWCLLVSRYESDDFRAIFDGFNFPFKLIGLSILTGLITLVGYLLFIIPGVVLYFMYSQAVLVMFEDPDKGVIQCLRESREMMSGNKLNMFVIALSFIGWAILGSLISNVVSLVFEGFGLTFLTAYSSVFFNTWFNTYSGLTYAGFYNTLTGYEVTEPPELPESGDDNDNDEEDDDDDYRF